MLEWHRKPVLQFFCFAKKHGTHSFDMVSGGLCTSSVTMFLRVACVWCLNVSGWMVEVRGRDKNKTHRCAGFECALRVGCVLACARALVYYVLVNFLLNVKVGKLRMS